MANTRTEKIVDDFLGFKATATGHDIGDINAEAEASVRLDKNEDGSSMTQSITPGEEAWRKEGYKQGYSAAVEEHTESEQYRDGFRAGAASMDTDGRMAAIEERMSQCELAVVQEIKAIHKQLQGSGGQSIAAALNNLWTAVEEKGFRVVETRFFSGYWLMKFKPRGANATYIYRADNNGCSMEVK